MSGAQAPRAGGNGRPERPIAKFAIGIVFLCAMTMTGAWVMRGFFNTPKQPGGIKPAVVLPDDVADDPQIMSQGLPVRIFNGTVADSATHKPVNGFAVRVAIGMKVPTGGERIEFLEPKAKTFDGSYSLSVPIGQHGNWYLEIEAHGYLPFTSPPLSDGGTNNFELTAGNDLAGRVTEADGRPIEGVTVVVTLPGMGTNIHDGKFTSYGQTQTVTDADGRYDLPPQTGQFVVVAVGDAGYAAVDQDAIAKSTDIRLPAWGRIEGRVMVGDKPAAGVEVAVSSMLDSEKFDGRPRITNANGTHSGADGRYILDRVKPGDVGIGYIVENRFSAREIVTGFTQTRRVAAISGQSIKVDLGGAGRPVTGKLILPKQSKTREFLLEGGATRVASGGSAPSDLCPLFTTNGAFTIPDVPPGDYKMMAMIKYGEEFGPRSEVNFTMPPIPGGRSDEPLVLPDIKLGT